MTGETIIWHPMACLEETLPIDKSKLNALCICKGHIVVSLQSRLSILSSMSRYRSVVARKQPQSLR